MQRGAWMLLVAVVTAEWMVACSTLVPPRAQPVGPPAAFSRLAPEGQEIARIQAQSVGGGTEFTLTGEGFAPGGVYRAYLIRERPPAASRLLAPPGQSDLPVGADGKLSMIVTLSPAGLADFFERVEIRKLSPDGTAQPVLSARFAR